MLQFGEEGSRIMSIRPGKVRSSSGEGVHYSQAKGEGTG